MLPVPQRSSQYLKVMLVSQWRPFLRPFFPPRRYGLSEQELHDVEEQLQELLAARQQPGGGPGAAAGGLAQGSGGAAGGRAQREADLLGALLMLCCAVARCCVWLQTSPSAVCAVCAVLQLLTRCSLYSPQPACLCHPPTLPLARTCCSPRHSRDEPGAKGQLPAAPA